MCFLDGFLPSSPTFAVTVTEISILIIWSSLTSYSERDDFNSLHLTSREKKNERKKKIST